MDAGSAGGGVCWLPLHAGAQQKETAAAGTGDILGVHAAFGILDLRARCDQPKYNRIYRVKCKEYFAPGMHCLLLLHRYFLETREKVHGQARFVTAPLSFDENTVMML